MELALYNETHVHNIEITSDDPLAKQPSKIKVELKPHQLGGLHKMYIMEHFGKTYYHVDTPEYYISNPHSARLANIKGNFNIKSNIGIIGDVVGYGKTLLALSIIAANNINTIYQERELVYSYNSRNYVNFTATCESIIPPDTSIKSTLIVVPRGPVYVQWENAIANQTSFTYLSLDSLPTIRRVCPPANSTPAVIKEFFEKYDIVLVKNTALKTMIEYYYTSRSTYNNHPIYSWNRVMIDEAHDIISRMPILSFKFLWIISGTYQMLINRAFGSRTQMSYAIRDILTDERMNLVLIKGKPEYVRSSFSVPPPIEHSYLCTLPTNIAILQPYLNGHLQEMINANDIKGAIQELGGTNETEDEILTLFTREVQREIDNKNREIEFYNSIDIPVEQKTIRIHNLQKDVSELIAKINNIKDRVTLLSEKTCPICYDNFNNPIVLQCTHIYCGGCLLKWMRNGNNCPACRLPIESQKLIAIVKENEKTEVREERQISLSKEETLLKLLRDKPNGRFLVFSRVDNGFWRLAKLLADSNISYSEMKGSTSHMMNVLEQFRNGELRIILLNTYYAGSGIDISCATDLVLFHNMGIDAIQSIGRAQRVGRTEPLHIHTLLYSTEM